MAALFDLDGTLINSEPRSMATWAMLMEAHGVSHDAALLREFMGRPGREVLAEKLEMFGDEAEVEELWREVWSYGSHPDLPEVETVPGAAELVRAVHGSGSPTALVTSATRWWAEEMLTKLEVRELFPLVISAEDVSVGKPDPSGYLMAAERLAVDPSRCVVFEDSIAGITAAKAAGMACVGLTTTHEPHELAGADLVVADLTEIDWPLRLV
ncbi:HAD family phosphatase [Bailinhaonella thermotolerans]|uniref:HAD family phosphatase n=2 Tax=Bailinhaonella thermotolerans TaxID=1070861 RepID=A0A3A4AXK0_9ACTN|nr:HAD family phosphatase [Bailinhaonella thermotolerans]